MPERSTFHQGDYTVLGGKPKQELLDKVKYHLHHGWHLVGGVSVVYHPVHGTYFYQAMAKPYGN